MRSFESASMLRYLCIFFFFFKLVLTLLRVLKRSYVQFYSCFVNNMKQEWLCHCRKDYCEAARVKYAMELVSIRVCLFVHEILYELFQTTNFITCY